MPTALGRKIKYRFPAWQALEVFSERQPLIFSYYLCLCGSFFLLTCMWHLCVFPSVFLPSAIRKVPGETAFLHHLLIPFPQRQHFPRFSAVAAWLFSLRPCCRSSVWPYASVPFPQRQCFPRFGAVAAWLSSRHPFHRPSARHCPSVPFPQRQRFPRFGAVAAWLFSLRPCSRSSARHCPSVPFPQRQCFPRFGAVAVPRSGRCRPKRHFSTTFSNSL